MTYRLPWNAELRGEVVFLDGAAGLQIAAEDRGADFLRHALPEDLRRNAAHGLPLHRPPNAEKATLLRTRRRPLNCAVDGYKIQVKAYCGAYLGSKESIAEVRQTTDWQWAGSFHK